ncbi:MAG: TetR/AcrR family transcriptional regulator [Desulfomonile sp.]|nr:TetR/AcrR family transcriptional regulator [Desulfomonile sp.]
MNYAEFQEIVVESRQELFRETIARHRATIRVRKEAIAIRNLAKIFDAVLEIANRKGFAAMSMRDLSSESGLSIGALYSYFSSKEELLEMLQNHGRTIATRIMDQRMSAERNSVERLRAAIRTHLYLSEAMQPWFYFSYMEAKNLSKVERDKAIASELYTEKVLEDILREGGEAGVFLPRDYRLAASVMKAMLQDWYLKRGKYTMRRISVDQYADFVVEFVESFVLKDGVSRIADSCPGCAATLVPS